MKISRYVIVVVGVVVTVASIGAAVVRARQNPMVNGQADGSIAGLTVEVHALRLSIEEAAKNQQQVQGVGVYLSVQKDRLLQTVARLDAARKETVDATEAARRVTGQLAATERELQATDLPPSVRSDLENNVRALKVAIDRAKQSEVDARGRESLAEQAVQTEEQRWNELVSRLETLIRK